jgi:hypothetical protein
MCYKQDMSKVQLVVGQSPVSKDANTETEEIYDIGSYNQVTKMKVQQFEKTSYVL